MILAQSNWSSSTGEKSIPNVRVRIRAHAGKLEKIPRAADSVAGFENCEFLGAIAALQDHCGADSRQSGADDQNIDILRRGAGILGVDPSGGFSFLAIAIHSH